MADLYRPTYVSKGSGRKRRTAKWYAWFTHPQTGRKVRVPLCTDKVAAQQLLAEMVRQAERAAAGLTDPYEQHRRRPLAEHFADWETALLAGARPTKRARNQARQTVSRARRVFEACGFMTIPDISASRVLEYIGDLRVCAPPSGNGHRPHGLSLQTVNFYLAACRQFTRWLVRDRRTNDNLLAFLQGWNVRLDRRHDRRDLSVEELRWLLEAARSSPHAFRRLAGRDRSMLYRVALGTGFRASELASLCPHDFFLEAEPPVVRVLAAFSKNQKEVDQPLHADLADALQDYLHSLPADRPVWPGSWVVRASQMIQKDLAVARAGWIDAVAADAAERRRREASSFLVYRDESGRVADFHALRHTFISLLARGGVNPKLAQVLARHSDINLTMGRYTHVELFDVARALEAIPKLLPNQQQERGGAPRQAAG